MSDSVVNIALNADTGGLSSAIGSAKDMLSDLSASLSKMATDAAGYGTQVVSTAKLLGTSTQQIGELSVIAKESGTNLKDLSSTVLAMDENIASGSHGARQALASLGLSVQQFIQLPVADQLSTLAASFENVSSAQRRNAIAVELVGQKTGAFFDVIDQGSGRIDEFKNTADQIGVALSGSEAEGLDEIHRRLIETSKAAQGVSSQLTLEFKPAIDSGSRAIQDLSGSFVDNMRKGGWVKDTIDGIADALKLAVTSAEAAITAIREALTFLGAGFDEIYLAIAGLVPMLQAVWNGLVAGFETMFESIVRAAQQAARGVGQSFSDVGSVISSTLRGHFADAREEFDKLKADGSAAMKSLEESLKGSLSGFDFSKLGVASDTWKSQLKSRGSQMLGDEAKISAQYANEVNLAWKPPLKSGSKDLGPAGHSSSSPPPPAATPTQSHPPSQLQSAQVALAQQVAAAKAAFSQIAQTNAQANQARTASDASAANQSVAVEMRAINAQIAAVREGLRQKEEVLSSEVAQHKISQQQKFAALETETQQEYQAELALLEKERGLDGLKATQAQAVENKILALKQQNDLAMVRLDEQSVADQQHTWDGYFDTIESGFNSQLRGLLAGTTKWGQAFKNILGDLIIKFIEMCEKMVFQWAASEIAQTTATTTGAAARAAANTGAAAASSSETIASVLQSITASAGEAFAGIFGFLSPVMGPAAAGPAAAGQASVLAAAGGISAFAQGSWELPSDMVAQVHKGEMIVPAAQTSWAQSLMANAGKAQGAGGDVHVHHATHFNISAMDSSDVKRWISNNGKTILKTINNSVRHGAHLGLDKLSGA